MNNQEKLNPMAGGIFIALGTIGGTILGGINHQLVRGMLLGFLVGAIMAAAIWLLGRARSRRH